MCVLREQHSIPRGLLRSRAVSIPRRSFSPPMRIHFFSMGNKNDRLAHATERQQSGGKNRATLNDER